MPDLNQAIYCDHFETLGQLKDGFGTTNPNNGKTCTGCPKFKYMDGLITCAYLHELAEKGDGTVW